MKRLSAPIGALLFVCVLSRPAEAQIYSWRDANGVLVLSNVPPNGSAPAVPAAREVPVHQVSARVSPQLLMSVGAPYEPLIQQHSLMQGIRNELVRAVIQVESAFNPRAVSPKGAMGLMQLMPATAARLGVLDPFNPAENIRAGVRYLRELLNRYSNNEQLALAAYNAGPQAVDRHGSKIPPYAETQNYVKRITALQRKGSPGLRIYKQLDIVDGQPVVRYTNVRPNGGTFQEVAR